MDRVPEVADLLMPLGIHAEHRGPGIVVLVSLFGGRERPLEQCDFEVTPSSVVVPSPPKRIAVLDGSSLELTPSADALL
jgi:hypothetical protein